MLSLDAEGPNVEVELVVLPSQHVGLLTQVVRVAAEVLLADLTVVRTGGHATHFSLACHLIRRHPQTMLELQFLRRPTAVGFLGKGGGTCWGRTKAGVK
jgi:hypothetical protein